MRSLKILSALWGVFVVLIYPFISKFLNPTNWLIKLKRSNLDLSMYDLYALFHIACVIVMGIIVVFVLYKFFSKYIYINNCNNIKINVYISIIYFGMGAFISIQTLQLILNLLVKTDMNYMFSFVFMPIPFAIWRESYLVRDLKMLIFSLLILLACVAISTIKLIKGNNCK